MFIRNLIDTLKLSVVIHKLLRGHRYIVITGCPDCNISVGAVAGDLSSKEINRFVKGAMHSLAEKGIIKV